MTKTDAAVQTLSDINPDVILEVNTLQDLVTYLPYDLITCVELLSRILYLHFLRNWSFFFFLLACDP